MEKFFLSLPVRQPHHQAVADFSIHIYPLLCYTGMLDIQLHPSTGLLIDFSLEIENCLPRNTCPLRLASVLLLIQLQARRRSLIGQHGRPGCRAY